MEAVGRACQESLLGAKPSLLAGFGWNSPSAWASVEPYAFGRAGQFADSLAWKLEMTGCGSALYE